MALQEKIGCRHRAKARHEICWDHCVTPDECAATPWRQAAHGGLTIVETCRCGATREIEANGEHRNVGPWTHERESQLAATLPDWSGERTPMSSADLVNLRSMAAQARQYRRRGDRVADVVMLAVHPGRAMRAHEAAGRPWPWHDIAARAWLDWDKKAALTRRELSEIFSRPAVLAAIYAGTIIPIATLRGEVMYGANGVTVA